MSRVVLVVEVEAVPSAGTDPLTGPLEDLTTAGGRALAAEAGRELAVALDAALAGLATVRQRGVWLLAGEQAFRVLEVVPPRY